MATGVRAQLAVHAPSQCPVVSAADSTDARATHVTWTRTDGATAVEEFRVPQADADDLGVDADSVLDVGDRRVFRLERQRQGECVCEAIESLGYPVDSVQAVDGRLLVTLHLPALDDLRAVVAELGETAERVEVRYLVHDAVDEGEGTSVVVDRGRLTDRQQEVLATAFRMGYFEYPRDANATAVAEELGIDLSTFTEHLASAQSKLLDDVLPE